MITINVDMFLRNLFDILTKMSWIFLIIFSLLLVGSFISKKHNRDFQRSPIIIGCIICVFMNFLCRWIISTI